MKLEEKSNHQVRLCMSTRCNFCRRACPIYEVTGLEFDSPRAWLELINECMEGGIDELDIIPALNKCTQCKRCIEVCPNKIEVPEILLDFKNKVRKKYVPEPVEISRKKGDLEVDKDFRIKIAYPWNIVKNFILNGNPFNETPKKEAVGTREYVFFPGCIVNYKDQEVYDSCIAFFKKLGIRVDITHACCYTDLKAFGFSKDEIKKLFHHKYPHLSGKKIITPCAGCYHTLKEDHKLDVVHISELIHANMNRIRTGVKLNIALHDPCKLGRYHQIYDQPRKILKRTGANIVELKQNRRESHCCGGGGSLKYYYPKIQERVCGNLINLAEKDTTIVTNCSYCKQTIKKNTKQKVKHLVELI